MSESPHDPTESSPDTPDVPVDTPDTPDVLDTPEVPDTPDVPETPDPSADALGLPPVAGDGTDPDFAPYPGSGDFQAYPGGDFQGYPSGGEVVVDAPPPAAERADGSTACPRCDADIERWSGYCESCGQILTPTASMPTTPVAVESDDTPTVRRHPCADCGGVVGDDLYCLECGALAPSPRDHYREAPASWVAGVCDRGLKHHRNEDAMALSAHEEPGSRAVLIVCDGVSNADDSHIASLAAARAAREVLTEWSEDPDRNADVLTDTFAAAVAKANESVVAGTAEDSTNPPSCTFAAAAVDGDTVVAANIGDSRVYWIDDVPSDSVLLSVDDSVAQARIAMGIDRETAETGPQAHAITKWIGRDAPDLTPTVGTHTVTSSGWVLVCSDGLWNYASEPQQLADLFAEAIERNPGNQRIRSMAVSLVRWARQQGGRDNITVALARYGDFTAATESQESAGQDASTDESPESDQTDGPTS